MVLSGKESACQCESGKRLWFSPWVRKIPWRRKWQPTPVSLPEKLHGEKSLVAYSPKGHKELATTEWAHRSLLSRSGKSVHLCLVPDLIERASSSCSLQGVLFSWGVRVGGRLVQRCHRSSKGGGQAGGRGKDAAPRREKSKCKDFEVGLCSLIP